MNQVDKLLQDISAVLNKPYCDVHQSFIEWHQTIRVPLEDAAKMVKWDVAKGDLPPWEDAESFTCGVIKLVDAGLVSSQNSFYYAHVGSDCSDYIIGYFELRRALHELEIST